jgi:hypothetical protein
MSARNEEVVITIFILKENRNWKFKIKVVVFHCSRMVSVMKIDKRTSTNWKHILNKRKIIKKEYENISFGRALNLQ